MTILIVKLTNRVHFNNDNSALNYSILTGKAGKKTISAEFYGDAPKPLKTVEYKLVGEWRTMNNGRKIFRVKEFEKIGKVLFVKPTPRKFAFLDDN